MRAYARARSAEAHREASSGCSPQAQAIGSGRRLAFVSVRIPEAVRLTGISRSRLYELMKSGDIEFVKVGSSTLILVQSLRGFIDSRRVERDGL